MNVFAVFHAAIEEEVQLLRRAGAPADAGAARRFTVEPPRDPANGELATNAALVLARDAGVKPRELAERLAERLRARPGVASAKVAGPGFVNLRLAPAFWQARLGDILRVGESYGDSRMGRGRRVNVEYVSANPTGPLHVGHGRGAVVGDALASLLAKAGFAVTREYYVNDAGVQIDLLARSLHLRYREALGEEIGAIPEGHYPGEYLAETARRLVARDGGKWLGAGEADWLPALRAFAVDAMMASIREDLAALGIRHDVFASERALTEAGAVERVVAALEARGLVYVGTLEAPKGKAPDDWEARPQTLFRATCFGDDIDRPLRKSDGSWTYFAADIAYHHDKFRRDFPTMIDVWGADHKGYVKRMTAAVEAATEGAAALDVRVCNLVQLLDRGEPVKMSKRAGSFVTLRAVVDEVGRDAARFLLLARSPEAALEFDLAKAIEQSRDNPVFYVQYAHARSCSAMRNAAERFPELALDDDALAGADASLLRDTGELALIRLLAGWPRVVEAAAEAREPHRVAVYLAEVAASFHGQWSRGNAREELRFVAAGDVALLRARIALARAAAIVIASGLKVLGVQPVEEMR